MFAAYGRNTERGIRERGICPIDESESAARIAADKRRAETRQAEERRRAEIARVQSERQRLRDEARLRERAAKARLAEIVSKYRCIEVNGRRSARDIITSIATSYGFTYREIVGVQRTKALVKVRHACIRAVADERPDWSLPMIGRVFGRDHTSILHALKKTAEPGKHWR